MFTNFSAQRFKFQNYIFSLVTIVEIITLFQGTSLLLPLKVVLCKMAKAYFSVMDSHDEH